MEYLTKEQLNNMDLNSIIKYLDSLCTFNYYTGGVWSDSYDPDNILSDSIVTKLYELDSYYKESYLIYIKVYCSNNDIFILNDIQLNEYSEEYTRSCFILDIESSLLNLNEFNNYMEDSYYYESEEDFIDNMLAVYTNDLVFLDILYCIIDYSYAFDYFLSAGGVYEYTGGIIEYY